MDIWAPTTQCVKDMLFPPGCTRVAPATLVTAHANVFRALFENRRLVAATGGDLRRDPPAHRLAADRQPIPAEHLERVVLPFVQLDSALTRRHDGTGLGLALVKAMAEKGYWKSPGGLTPPFASITSTVFARSPFFRC